MEFEAIGQHSDGVDKSSLSPKLAAGVDDLPLPGELARLDIHFKPLAQHSSPLDNCARALLEKTVCGELEVLEQCAQTGVEYRCQNIGARL